MSFSLVGGVDSDAYREYVSGIPLHRESAKVDVAHAVLFCVSPAAKMITGHTLVADGGSWLTFANPVYNIISPTASNVKSKM